MADDGVEPTGTQAWSDLLDLKKKPVNMVQEFVDDPDRVSRFCLETDALTVDLSKNLWTAEIQHALIRLIEQCNFFSMREKLFAGDPVNFTEGRAALHMALRAEVADGYRVADSNVGVEVEQVLHSFLSFAEQVRAGHICAPNGLPFKHVVNIGIGGSDLGPHMVVRALAPYAISEIDFHFVSNIDGTHLLETLEKVEAAQTLFVVASKSFTTDETMTNAAAAKEWLIEHVGSSDAVAGHFVAISTALGKCTEFGIAPHHVFRFWDWVGGRYSLWSSIGLPVAIAIGAAGFKSLLAGARAMDQHFFRVRPEKNIPVMMGALGIWYRNFHGAQTHAILPYDQQLEWLPAYLQQADMESNGKHVRYTGQSVKADTGPIIWGQPGVNGQHAFYQLFHQGTTLVPLDFLIAIKPKTSLSGHHDRLLANCLAQGEALMVGKCDQRARQDMEAQNLPADVIDKLLPHRVFPGNRPSSTILYDTLDPYTLGQIIALYEHKIFVQAALWGINPFDQWGVELGKQLAQSLLPALQEDHVPDRTSPSTQYLLGKIKAART